MIFNLPFIDILFLPIILFIGIVTSFEDFKFGKIRNKWILFGFFYWLILFCAFFIWNLSFDGIFDYLSLNFKSTSLIVFEYSYLFSVIINGFVAIVFVFVLWEFGIIAAGDAKLFWLYSLLVPFTYYWKTYLPFFPSIVLFVNTFVIVIIYLFIISIFSYLKDNRGNYKNSLRINIKKVKSKYKKEELRLKIILGPVTGFLAIIVTINSLAAYYSINIQNLPAYVIILLFFFRRFLSNFFVKRNIMSYIALYLAAFSLYGFMIDAEMMRNMLWGAIKNLTILIITLTFIDIIIKRYIKNTSTKTINSNKLKKTMIVDRAFVYRLKQDKKYYEEKIGRIYNGSLNNKQTEAIKNWCKRNNIEKIEIFTPFRLAVWIFLGVIATLIYKGSLIKLFL